MVEQFFRSISFFFYILFLHFSIQSKEVQLCHFESVGFDSGFYWDSNVAPYIDIAH